MKKNVYFLKVTFSTTFLSWCYFPFYKLIFLKLHLIFDLRYKHPYIFASLFVSIAGSTVRNIYFTDFFRNVRYKFYIVLTYWFFLLVRQTNSLRMNAFPFFQHIDHLQCFKPNAKDIKSPKYIFAITKIEIISNAGQYFLSSKSCDLTESIEL